MISSFNNFLY